jgi:hypothetical protein
MAEAQRTPLQVLGEEQWSAAKAWMEERNRATPNVPSNRHLLVVSAMPVLYAEFDNSSWAWKGLPVDAIKDLEDDVQDHWSTRGHEGERLRLVKNLLAHATNARCKVTLLSGDIHVGAHGHIVSTANAPAPPSGGPVEIYQLISSAIVNYPPRWYEWWAIRAVSNTNRAELGTGIHAEMLALIDGEPWLRARNFLSIRPDPAIDSDGGPGDGRLWARFIAEDVVVSKQIVIQSEWRR